MTKLDEAIIFATKAHSGQKRKLTNEQYIIHPLDVAVIVASITSNEDTICAALLHDTVEDTNTSLEEIREKFGDRVAELVNIDSENKRHNLPAAQTWKIRKIESLERLKTTTDKDAKIIWLGDKLSNIRSIFEMYIKIGDKVWDAFNQKDKKEHQWYYESVVNALREEFNGTKAFYEYEKLVEYIFKDGE